MKIWGKKKEEEEGCEKRKKGGKGNSVRFIY